LLAQLYYIRAPKGYNTDRAHINKQVQINLNNVERELLEWDREEAIVLADEIRQFIVDNHLPYTFDPDFGKEPIFHKLATY